MIGRSFREKERGEKCRTRDNRGKKGEREARDDDIKRYVYVSARSFRYT